MPFQGEEFALQPQLWVTGFGEDKAIMEPGHTGNGGQEVGYKGQTLRDDTDGIVKVTQERQQLLFRARVG